ncbi:MAG: hydroxyacylglutathione hydrolase [Methylococcales bacterium]|nr:hydroxyacylglutathione hydrolase [Methylococcales bacterium]
MLEIIQLPVLTDNYIYILHDPDSNETGVIDPAISQPVLDTLKSRKWSLSYIFNTHHHSDHVGANIELKERTGCQIVGFGEDSKRIPGIDKKLKHRDEIKLGSQIAKVFATPGHTLGHIVYYFASNHVLFCGDTLFSMGCGRLFEGTAEQMWHSLQQLKSLPKETKIYCTHEYTQANGQFALTLEPDNQALIIKMQEVNKRRSLHQPTIPSTLEQELATNPFLRENSPALQQSINMEYQSSIAVFRKIRELKDNF